MKRSQPRDVGDAVDIPVYLEVQDAAHEATCSPAWIRRLAESGALRVAARTRRGTRLFARADVERLAAERRQRLAERSQRP